MDRLICGDAGYGKTEVALRAALQSRHGQHAGRDARPYHRPCAATLQTFIERLAPFPVKVELLSRFRTDAEQHRVLEKLAEGKVDIVIGTHRLLQKDVVIRNLGLVIIDEEQRFGVANKERLKQMRTEVDVLTLTATPIPRTLYMALAGVRDISIIETPPQERLPIATYVGTFDAQMARRAILREVNRGGQVFYVHNRVESIETVAARLRTLVPDVPLAIAHGQMPERELSKVMGAFTTGDVSILLATTIIESGLDFPNANTLIVERSDRFGLAQLYQLRRQDRSWNAPRLCYFFLQAPHDRGGQPTPFRAARHNQPWWRLHRRAARSRDPRRRRVAGPQAARPRRRRRVHPLRVCSAVPSAVSKLRGPANPSRPSPSARLRSSCRYP